LLSGAGGKGVDFFLSRRIKDFFKPAVLYSGTNSGREWKPEKGKLLEKVGRKTTGLHPGKPGHGGRVAERALTSSGSCTAARLFAMTLRKERFLSLPLPLLTLHRTLLLRR
jgi:hypothetical protein